MMTRNYDAVVIGAGFSGIYAVHKLRDELGLEVKGIEAAESVGGVWHWNRYPGARCDVPSVNYAYSFSEELTRGWQWTERFAAQPEIYAYLNYAADFLDVRKAFDFSTRVVSAEWNDAAKRWTVTTDGGVSYSARFLIGAQGSLSTPKDPSEITGVDDFGGELYYTSKWPDAPVTYAGKRVGLIGTGSTGTQVAEVVAGSADRLTVFQRTANFAIPGGNGPVAPDMQRWEAENAAVRRSKDRLTVFGITWEEEVEPVPAVHTLPPAERNAILEERWARDAYVFIESFPELLTDAQVNECVSEYVREQIRARVKDPAVAALLCPNDHPIMTKRIVLENGYYEIFNQDNVDLVDIRANPIEQITVSGVRLADGTELEFDVLIMATGFDSITGPPLALGLRGREGLTLEDIWNEGPRTYLSTAVPGFPNLFFIVGPTAPAAFYNNPVAIEDHVDFAVRAIRLVLEQDAEAIEASREAADRWYEISDGLFNNSLLPRANSWYRGSNVPGKLPATYVQVGSGVFWRACAEQIVAKGLAGFAIDGDERPLSPLMKLSWASARLVDEVLVGREGQPPPPLGEAGIGAYRDDSDAWTISVAPPRRDVGVVDTTYPGPDGEQHMRLFVPRGGTTRPVLLFYYGGGFVSGSVEALDGVLRMMAADLDLVVAAPTYRLAPEHPFPAAPQDAYAALRWVADNIAAHGGDPDRIVVAGESAGGNLAAVVALRARDEGPVIAGQVLLEPAIDVVSDSPSRREFADDLFLPAEDLETMWALYLGENADADRPCVSPRRAASLEGLPPAVVVVAECDPLRDEGEAYAEELTRAAVPTTLVRLEGAIHGGLSFVEVLPEYGAAFEAIGGLFRRVDASSVTQRS
jgi:cation diffusion facilitator CzcD-associated flavoprotein CzcO/acetyl esterase/lipase